jgi:hypothetical protein
MGRVSRYKKLKSCDPFAKKKAVVVDPKYDQEPSLNDDDFTAWSDDDLEGFDECSKDTGNAWAKPKKLEQQPAQQPEEKTDDDSSPSPSSLPAKTPESVPAVSSSSSASASAAPPSAPAAPSSSGSSGDNKIGGSGGGDQDAKKEQNDQSPTFTPTTNNMKTNLSKKTLSKRSLKRLKMKGLLGATDGTDCSGAAEVVAKAQQMVREDKKAFKEVKNGSGKTKSVFKHGKIFSPRYYVEALE